MTVDMESVSRESSPTVAEVVGVTRDITLPWMTEATTFRSDELPVLVKPDSRISLATDERLLTFLKDAEYFESVLQGEDDQVVTRLADAHLL